MQHSANIAWTGGSVSMEMFNHFLLIGESIAFSFVFISNFLPLPLKKQNVEFQEIASNTNFIHESFAIIGNYFVSVIRRIERIES